MNFKLQTIFFFSLLLLISSNPLFSSDENIIVSSKPIAKDNIDENTPFPSKEVLLAESGEWIIKQIYFKQGSKYVLFKKDLTAKNEIKMNEDSTSIFSLLHKISDKKLQISLAQNALNKWIAKDGREKVQKFILGFESLTALQRDLYTEAGFKLPEKYSIYLQ